MPRKKTNVCGGERTTISAIKSECDWGRILYNACYMFNKGFAEYLVDYAKRYDNGEITVDDRKMNDLMARRDKLASERDALHMSVKKATKRRLDAFNNYVKSSPVGDAVTDWRRNGNQDQYCDLIRRRASLGDIYRSCVMDEKKAMHEERRHIDANLYALKTLNYQLKNVTKMMDKHNFQLDHRMQDDVDALYAMITSEKQTERLMAVCFNILNTYSQKEFSTFMTVLDRERIVEKIYGFFTSFEHNYDFISGCYDYDEETGLLKLKPLDVLESKIYNGYYFTIRGYVQRSYASVRFEKYNVESVDTGIGGEDGTQTLESIIPSDMGSEFAVAVGSREPKPLDDGMMDIWTDCNEYLVNSIDQMSVEIVRELSRRFPRNPYYSNKGITETMGIVMLYVIDGINEELSAGNIVGNKLRHIISAIRNAPILFGMVVVVLVIWTVPPCSGKGSSLHSKVIPPVFCSFVSGSGGLPCILLTPHGFVTEAEATETLLRG